MYKEFPTIDELLAELKTLKAGWGGQTTVKNLVYGGHAVSLKRFWGFKINKHGRGSAREHDIELLWKDVFHPDPLSKVESEEGN